MMSPVLLLMVNMLEEGLSGFWDRILYRSIPLAVLGSSLSTEVTVITKDPETHTQTHTIECKRLINKRQINTLWYFVCVCVCVCVCVGVCAIFPGLDPSGTEPLNTVCVNSGLLSFMSMTLMTMSMGFSTWFPFRSTA